MVMVKKKELIKSVIVISACTLLVSVFGCGNKEVPKNEQLKWTVSVVEHQVKEKLEAVDDVRQYDGSIAKVSHKNIAENGKTFLLINIDAKKNVSGNNPLVWKNLVVQNNKGESYARMQDVFIADYKYQRMAGTDLKLDAKGWVCYSVPKNDNVKDLKLIYTEDDKKNVMKIVK